MEKQSKLTIQILKFLSQAAAPAVTYKGSPASPRHPVVSIIPKEARRKQSESGRFSLNEPTSPKVSCMGQVKGKGKKKKKSKPKAKQVYPPPPPPPQESTNLALCVPKEKTFEVYMIPKALIDEGNTKDAGSFASNSLSRSSSAPERVPSLGQMKRFESRRGVLSDFDLLKVDDDLLRLDNLKIGVAGEEDNDDDDKKNKKEVLLWKRRSLCPLTPLQL